MSHTAYTLGLASVSFRQHTPEEILQVMRAVGLTCVEWGADIHAPCHDTARLREIATLQETYGISCSSYGTYFRLGEMPIHELEASIAAAHMLNTTVLRLWCGSKNGEAMTAEEREVLLQDCRIAASMAEKHGVTVCLECHRNTFTERIRDAVWLMETINSPHFRMYWQPFQWQTVAENLDNARAIAPYAEHLHVFHWQGDRRLPLTDAIPDWRGYLQAFSTPRTLLLEFMPTNTIEELAVETAALKTIVEGDR